MRNSVRNEREPEASSATERRQVDKDRICSNYSTSSRGTTEMDIAASRARKKPGKEDRMLQQNFNNQRPLGFLCIRPLLRGCLQKLYPPPESMPYDSSAKKDGHAQWEIKSCRIPPLICKLEVVY
jgi:hypothetical protein